MITPVKRQRTPEAKAAPAPKTNHPAEIIYPEHYLYSVRLMGPGRFDVDVPMVRIGSAGWGGMQIGGAA